MLIKQAEEIIKCGASFPYFCENYVQHLHPVRGYLPFKLSPWQIRLGNELEENRFVISKKWRQGGITTVHLLYGLWLCMFKEKKKIMWISKTKREAEQLSEMFTLVMRMLPDWMKPRLERNNLREKTFTATGGDIIFTILQAARGHACTHVLIDEAAYITRMEWHWKAIWPVLSTGGRCFIMSTVNHGPHGLWFSELYMGAQKNTNWFHIFESSYTEHPDYQKPDYVKALKENLGEEGWDIEIEGLLFKTPKPATIDAGPDPAATA